MKVNSLALLAGAGGLFFSWPADASFIGMSWDVSITAEGTVFRVYANFDTTTDHMVAVAGTPRTSYRFIAALNPARP